uniref:Uncharacterized protein n=1 Tax=Nothobranchius furzeri TaxID=105023 RepID=A0A8C6NXU3_NOTFU
MPFFSLFSDCFSTAEPTLTHTIMSVLLGSLLLLVNGSASSPLKDFIPHTALGVLLLIITVLVAYAGVRHSLSHTQLFSTLCLTVSALWCGSGLIYILVGQGVLQLTDLKDSLVPGLAAFTLALFIIGSVTLFVKKQVLFLIAVCISSASAHQIADLCAAGFGKSATAANYLLVCLVCVHFGFGRLLSTITQGTVRPPGVALKLKAELKTDQNQRCSDVARVGLVMNLLSASVLACPLLHVVPKLPVGHVPMLWTAGVFQLSLCVLFYRSLDILAATFYGFTALLRFAEGYSALLSWYSIQPFSPVPFPVVFAVLFSTLALFSCQKSLLVGLYQLFFVAYMYFHCSTAQRLLSRRYSGSAGCYICSYGWNAVHHCIQHGFQYQDPAGQGVFKALVTRMGKLKPRALDEEQHEPHLGYSKYADAEVLGHAYNVLAAFAITATVGDRTPQYVLVLPWVVVAGGVLHTVFILYGVMWTVWGLTRYGGLYGETRGFNVAVGIISFMLFNLLVTNAALFLIVAWFVYAFTFQLIVMTCNRPDAVTKAYKYVSICLTDDGCLHLLSRLLLDFMKAAWPSSISMVIPRGDAAIHIGTPQSIAIRNPDCAVVDGVLCDGPPPENIASTVVDCTKIDTGNIGFFRVGLIPKSKVLQILEEVRNRHRSGQTNPGFVRDEFLPQMEEDQHPGDNTSESERGSETQPNGHLNVGKY